MATKVGINGFGRIGRQVLKAIGDFYPKTLEVVAFNDIGDLKTMAHLLKYDSNYGRFNGTVEVADDGLHVDGKLIKAFKETDPGKIPWGDLGVDIVIESTGLFTNLETSNPRNLGWYHRFRFETERELRAAPGKPAIWTMRRPGPG